MEKLIKINGTFTKEQLKEKMKEFDKPVWTISKGDVDSSNWIQLFKDGESEKYLFNIKNSDTFDWFTIGLDIAFSMKYIIDVKDVVKNTPRYNMYYNTNSGKWGFSDSFGGYIDTWDHAYEIANMLSESEDLKAYIDKLKGCE